VAKPLVVVDGTICRYDRRLGGWRCRQCWRGLLLPGPGQDAPAPGTRCPGCQAPVSRVCHSLWQALPWGRILVALVLTLPALALAFWSPFAPWVPFAVLAAVAALAFLVTQD
jgi:hypothetical protein